jgi:hypothetical protein
MNLRFAGIVLSCAFDNRGTRAYRRDLYASFTDYGVADDKIR